MANTYDVGDKVRTQVSFTDDGVVTDPSAITYKFKTPAGVTTTYVYGTDVQLVKLSTGIYYVDLTIALEGRYDWRFEGTGALVAAYEGSFWVRLSEF